MDLPNSDLTFQYWPSRDKFREPYSNRRGTTARSCVLLGGSHKLMISLFLVVFISALIGSGGGNRTPDRVINSHLLYRLSYA